MRQIVLDTETTGLDPATHRIIEIGCVELVNHVPTGRHFHTYLNPERASDARAFEVHKLSDDFLKGQPLFNQVADEFLAFLAGDQLVIHNAEFDMGFVNWELRRIDRETLRMSRVVDTIAIARQKYPGAQASLDALCRRFEIDLAIRAERHGALIDAGLLARVYLELIGGRQPGLDFAVIGNGRGAAMLMPRAKTPLAMRPPRRDLPGAQPTAEELALHDKFLGKIKDPVWRKG
ncbi:MAG TPA: DNA polymerase III subunit epsilon [Alphaproteobacteria bacterium]|jgi:DNA polymerase-3 subunit epsilon